MRFFFVGATKLIELGLLDAVTLKATAVARDGRAKLTCQFDEDGRPSLTPNQNQAGKVKVNDEVGDSESSRSRTTKVNDEVGDSEST